jgi:hypothetical protein
MRNRSSEAHLQLSEADLRAVSEYATRSGQSVMLVDRRVGPFYGPAQLVDYSRVA